MRVLHGPVNVGNQPWTLSRAERALGVKSDLIVNYNTWLGYPADRVLSKYRANTRWDYLNRCAAGFGAPFRYSVLHYYFGRSMLAWDDYGADAGWPFLDLRLAKRLGRKVFFTLQGCDARIAGDSNARNAVTMCKPDGCSAYAVCRAELDDRRQRLIKEILPLADRVFYLNPELGHYVPAGQFLPYANVDIEATRPEPGLTHNRPRILHAPSDASVKGTALIEAALAELSRDFDFEYVALRNCPHDEAMRLYHDSDLAIDQVLAGWYGGFAVELMAMAKPVACYLRDEDLGFIPKPMRDELPILRIDPRTLADDLAAILRRRQEWQELGAKSRAFALRWHNPARIAVAMVRAYRDRDSRFVLSPVEEPCAA
jgi:hypothetical protein